MKTCLIDVIDFRVIRPDSGQRILAGTVERSLRPNSRGLSGRTKLWKWGAPIAILLIIAFTLSSGARCAESQNASASPEAKSSSTSTDFFVMIGSDFDRPGLLPRANYNIGIGYTYENAGSHAFLHDTYGEHTESAGVMKNFSLPKATAITGYTWLQSGITSYTGSALVKNRLDSGVSLGAIVHCAAAIRSGFRKATIKRLRFLGSRHRASVTRIAGESERPYGALAVVVLRFLTAAQEPSLQRRRERMCCLRPYRNWQLTFANWENMVCKM